MRLTPPVAVPMATDRAAVAAVATPIPTAAPAMTATSDLPAGLRLANTSPIARTTLVRLVRVGTRADPMEAFRSAVASSNRWAMAGLNPRT